jgi:hypothetical protein
MIINNCLTHIPAKSFCKSNLKGAYLLSADKGQHFFDNKRVPLLSVVSYYQETITDSAFGREDG